MPANKRQVIACKTRRGSPEEKQFNINFWQMVPEGDKLVAAWEMIGEIAIFKGQTNAGESGLQRSVAHVERRRR
jgi:hypothetical protein